MSKQANLLLVDDEERVLRTLKSLFRSEYEIFTTTEGKEAIDIAKNNSIHVVISDQRMPSMTGVELLREIKDVSPNSMRLLLTGYADLAAIVGSVNDGEIFRYINKPWVPEEIEASVKEAAQIAISLQAAPKTNATAPMPEQVKEMGFLVIDKDEATYKAVKEIVGKTYKVHWCKNVNEAFALLANEKIAVIVTEVNIDDEDITAPLKTLKQINPSVLALVVTSFQDTRTLIDLINQGQIYRFLPKPIMHKMLERSLQASMSHYQTILQMPQLLKRHTVEKPAEKTGGLKISSTIMGYLNKIRGKTTA